MGDEENSVGGEDDQAGGAVLIRIHVPDLNIHKCLQFYKHDFVWDVKQQCLASLPKELKESFNYGLYAPPCNGKAGKFLEEERPLADYPFSGPVGYLELRYKRRLYKGLNVDEKTLKQLHSKSNLRRFFEYVQQGQCEKIAKMCGKGLDPNFHDPESGETPLSVGAVMKKPSKVLIALVNGGALLDFRNRDGSTPMHRAVESKNLVAVRTMLDLGGSPNYKDSKGLTPLYHSIVSCADPSLCESLLHDHAFIGAQDMQGWHETHQACRNGLVQHLIHLLYYGADMNARNASGNTPLHVCAVNNQESCARLLLFRGADKEALNYANQTPYQVAVIAGNMELAEIIQNHKPQDVVPFRDLPKYNPKRRSYLARAFSDPRLNGSMICLSGRASKGPPSPCPSNRSLPPYSSASSCLSECSAYTRCGSCSDSSCSGASSEDRCGSAITDKSLDHSDITSDSSGVGTCNSGGSGSSYDATPTDPALLLPGMMVVCVENYANDGPGHLKLTEGDIIEVTGSTDDGFLEGSLRGVKGMFPAACVQEIRMKSYENRNNLAPPSYRPQGKNCKNVPRFKKIWNEPHTVILHRGQKGFGFVLRGAKADSPLMDLQPSDRFPALQYLDDVDENGVADRAGLRKGDFILSINGVDVSQCSHEIVVDMIRKSGDLVSLTVVGLSKPIECMEGNGHKPGSPSSLTCEQGTGGGDGSKTQYQFATLPRKHSGTGGPNNVPSPPRRDPSTSLSVGRARAKSMVAALADLGIGASQNNQGNESQSNNEVGSNDSVSGKPPLPPGSNNLSQSTTGTLQSKTASIRSRPPSSRITTSEIEDIFYQKSDDTKLSTFSSHSHKIYTSVSEMKRSKTGLKSKDLIKLHKDFHSTPDLKDMITNISNGTLPRPNSQDGDTKPKSLSQENLSRLRGNMRHSWACISSVIPNLLDKNYEKSWRSIEKLAAQAKKKQSKSKGKGSSKNDDEGNESDASNCSVSSCSSNGSRKGKKGTAKKTPVLTEGEYRTIKPLRPVQSKTLPRRASTGCNMGSMEQQTIINLVPPGQVIKVDVSKSKEYSNVDVGTGRKEGNVMSSFKPSDSAKLYASPDDLKTIGYREQSNEQNSAYGTMKKFRSQSVPRKDGNRKDDHASSEGIKSRGRDDKMLNGGAPDLAREAIANENNMNRNDSFEKASAASSNKKFVNVSANRDQENANFDPQKSLQEAKDRLKPVKPALKSSPNAEDSKHVEASEIQSSDSKIRIEVKQSPRLARKAEKTVTFQPDSTTVNSSNAGSVNNSNQMSHSMSVDEIQKVKTSLKSSKSFPNDLGQDENEAGTPTETQNNIAVMVTTSNSNYVTCLPVNPDSDSSEDSSDKTWILKDDNGPSSSASDSVQTVVSNPGIITNSNEVCTKATKPIVETTVTSRFNMSDKLQNPVEKVIPDPLKQAANGQLFDQPRTPSNQEPPQQTYYYVTQSQPAQTKETLTSSYGTLGRGSNLRSTTNTGVSTSASNNMNLAKNAVSLTKLPPPLEIDSESEDAKNAKDNSSSTKRLNSATNTSSTNNVTHQLYHTLQPQKSKSMLVDHQYLQQQQNHILQQQQQQAQLQQQQLRQLQLQQAQLQSSMRPGDKSIEESLKLIQMHVAALKKQDQHSVVPPPPEFNLRNQTPILEPPPEFSDARDTHESATRFNQGHLHHGDPNAAMHQHFNRQSPMYRSISHSHSSSSSMYSGYPTMTRQQYQQQVQNQLHQQQLQQQYQQQQQHQQQQHQQQQHQQQQHQQQQQQQQQHLVHQQQQQSLHHQQHQAQSQQAAQLMSMSIPSSYQTLGRHVSYGSSGLPSQSAVNTSAYGHYQTLGNPTRVYLQQQQQQHHGHVHPQATPNAVQSAQMFQQHHPKCHYYQQTNPGVNLSGAGSASKDPKHINEKLHPVHRYTPDLYESTGPRIVGSIPKKQPINDHYEVPHAHQQLLQQQQQQQQQQAQGRIRREFRNKNLIDWSIVDACDWLDSLFMSEYKVIFQQRGIDGKKLIRMDNSTLLELGVKKLGHRMNIEKSLKRYMPQTKT